MYRNGDGVEKDKKKEVYHMEEAAISGYSDARHNLGCVEWENHRFDRAVKHWIIAANLGFDMSLKYLKNCYAARIISKEDFAAALRAHQAAVWMRQKVHRGTKEKQLCWQQRQLGKIRLVYCA